jgi:hypothetical protein
MTHPAHPGPTPEPGDPTPVPGLTVAALESLTQDIAHCDTPMRHRGTTTRWEGQYGSGEQITTTRRTCTICRASLTTITRTPS